MDPQKFEELVVKSSTYWSINDIPDWCGTIRPSHGEAGEWTVRIRGRFYEEKPDRTAILTVVAGDKSETLTLTQRGHKQIAVSPSVCRIPSAGGQAKLSVCRCRLCFGLSRSFMTNHLVSAERPSDH